eukprot:scaffold3790_cov105-Pinguiococcus_pyrenoidosus.AAC.1
MIIIDSEEAGTSKEECSPEVEQKIYPCARHGCEFSARSKKALLRHDCFQHQRRVPSSAMVAMYSWWDYFSLCRTPYNRNHSHECMK